MRNVLFVPFALYDRDGYAAILIFDPVNGIDVHPVFQQQFEYRQTGVFFGKVVGRAETTDIMQCIFTDGRPNRSISDLFEASP